MTSTETRQESRTRRRLRHLGAAHGAHLVATRFLCLFNNNQLTIDFATHVIRMSEICLGTRIVGSLKGFTDKVYETIESD